MSIKLKVGKKYRDGRNNIVNIIEHNPDWLNYQYMSDDGEFYTETGIWGIDELSLYDLIEEVIETGNSTSEVVDDSQEESTGFGKPVGLVFEIFDNITISNTSYYLKIEDTANTVLLSISDLDELINSLQQIKKHIGE